jgi:hypothetical protein
MTQDPGFGLPDARCVDLQSQGIRGLPLHRVSATVGTTFTLSLIHHDSGHAPHQVGQFGFLKVANIRLDCGNKWRDSLLGQA